MIIFFVQIVVFKYELTPVALCLATKASSSWPRCTSVEARTPAVDHHGSSPTFRHSPDLYGQVHKSVNVGPAPKRSTILVLIRLNKYVLIQHFLQSNCNGRHSDSNSWF